jgi:hypothetical protein
MGYSGKWLNSLKVGKEGQLIYPVGGIVVLEDSKNEV